MTFDEHLARVIEALGQLANQHKNDVEAAVRRSGQQRLEPGKSNGECFRAPPSFAAATATISCSNSVEADLINDPVLSEHGSSINTETDFTPQGALPVVSRQASLVSNRSFAKIKRQDTSELAGASAMKHQTSISGISLSSAASVLDYFAQSLSPHNLRRSANQQTDSGFKFDLHPASTTPIVGEVVSDEVLVEFESEGMKSEKEESGPLAPDSGTSIEEGQWTLLKSNAHFQLKKLWFDHMDLDRYKLAEVETGLLKEARWIKQEGLPLNEGANLSESRAINKTAFKTIEDMRKACQSHPDCVGFAYWPQRGWCFPKKAGTGFDPDTATYAQKHKNEIWEWHYMPSRAQVSKRKSELQWGSAWSEVGTDPAKMIAFRMRASEHGGSKFNMCVLHPTSKWRAVWLFMSMILLGYDMVMVPVSLCFELELATFDSTVQLLGAVFWSLDIIMTFCTGILNETSLEMRPLYIARTYAKSWLIFDVLLVTQEWAVQAMSQQTLSSVSLARALRWARTVRLLRVVRMLRFSKLQPILRQILYQYNLDKQGIALFGVWLNMTLLLLCAVHLTACLWHALGDKLSDGWIAMNAFDSGTVKRRYAISLRWTVGRLHGMASDYQVQNTSEIMLDSLLIFFSLFSASVYAGQVSALSMAWASSRMFSLRKLAHKYSYQHQISMALQKRVQNFLRAAHYGGAVQMAEDEERLLSELPRVLQEDLLFEARMRFIRVKHFFEDMYWLSPRAVQHLCKEAFSVVIAMGSEKIFDGGEVCGRMVFITSGACWYNCDTTTLQATPRPFDRHPASDPSNEFIQKGAALSEASLWTQWVHTGTLSANEETMLLGLDANVFGNVVLQHIEACLHAVKYGKRFIWHLNRCVQSDLVDFSNLRLDYLDQEFLDGSEDRHLAFISHYKLEAGTEATLMRDTLEQILKEDPSNEANFFENPVFVDSENLEDLATLKGHVESSEAMLLLLTPRVLSRPWCLLEIASAVAARIKVVPVEIQSPQYQYQYPDEEFYARLSAGKFLNKEAHSLLRNAGFELEDVTRAVREVHMKIALPFSPHKSKNVRHAELQDILRRCAGRGDADSGRSTKGPSEARLTQSMTAVNSVESLSGIPRARSLIQ